MIQFPNISKYIILLVAFVSVMLNGCSTLDSGETNLAIPKQSSAPIIGTYDVQMAGRFGKVEEYEGDIDGSITVETVLERSGARERFRGMDIVILRRLPKSPRPLRLEVDYTSAKGVSPEQNYAIHPGDTVVIQSKGNEFVGDVISSIAPGLTR